MGSFHESPEEKGATQQGVDSVGALTPAGCTDPGCERESNEDRLLMMCRGDVSGFFVFDGMGGMPAGEAAAQISSDVVKGALGAFAGGDLGVLMCCAIEMAQDAILSRRDDPATEGMGTTVVGAVIGHNEVVIGAVGDSRAYHIRPGSVAQLTCDHTLVQQLVDAGQISHYDALVHPQSHILTRCLGSTLDFAIDCKRYQLVCDQEQNGPNEWLLLCSDGLYSMVSEEEMVALVTNHTAEEASTKLIEVARSRGGFDNISAIVIPLHGRLIEQKEVDSNECEESTVNYMDEVSKTDHSSRCGLNGEDVELKATEHSRFSELKRVSFIAFCSALTGLGIVLWLAVMTMKEG